MLALPDAQIVRLFHESDLAFENQFGLKELMHQSLGGLYLRKVNILFKLRNKVT